MLRYSPILPEKAYIILWSLRTLTSQKRDRPCAHVSHGSHTSSAVRGWEREDGTQVDCTIVNAAGRHICSDYISVLLCLRLCVPIMDKPTEYKSKHRPTTVLETHLQQARICTQSPDSLGFYQIWEWCFSSLTIAKQIKQLQRLIKNSWQKNESIRTRGRR